MMEDYPFRASRTRLDLVSQLLLRFRQRKIINFGCGHLQIARTADTQTRRITRTKP